MSEDGRTRRNLLCTGTGLASTAALGGLSGCVSSVPGLGGGGGSPWYEKWLPGRGVLGVDGETHYWFYTLDFAALRNNEGSFSTETYATVTEDLRDAGDLLPGVEAIDGQVIVAGYRGGKVVVFEGSFAAADHVGEFEAEGYDRMTDYAGYAVYTLGDGVAFGLADGTLVARGGTDDTVAGLKGVIDVSEGEGERLTDASDDADALVSNLGTGLFANGVVPAGVSGGVIPSGIPHDALAANGLRGRVSGDSTDVRQVLVYDAPENVDTDDVREGSATAGRLDGVSVERSGRAALVEGSIPTAELTGGDLFGVRMAQTGVDQVPAASFDFDYDAGTGTLTITHAGGDVFIRKNTSILRYGIEGGTMEEWALPVETGTAVTLERDFSSGDEVQVVWTSPGGDRTVVVGRFSVP